MANYIRVGPDGLPYPDFSALTPDQAAAIQHVQVETSPAAPSEDGVSKIRFRLQLHNKRAALVDLGRHLGLFKDRVEHDVSDPLKQLYDAVCGKAFRPVEDVGK